MCRVPQNRSAALTLDVMIASFLASFDCSTDAEPTREQGFVPILRTVTHCMTLPLAAESIIKLLGSLLITHTGPASARLLSRHFIPRIDLAYLATNDDNVVGARVVRERTSRVMCD